MSITPFFHVYHKYVFIMANINKIRLSGTTYSIQDENATKTVELTQAEYDALSPKDPNTFYIITDAKGADLSNYYTKSETSGATEISTALESKADTATTYTKTETDNAITAATSTKQDTLVSGTNIKTINGETLLGEGNITIEGGGGGGKAISAGRGISITTGETADTVSFNLPISAGTGTNSLVVGGIGNIVTGNSSVAIGSNNKVNSRYSIAVGINHNVLSSNSAAFGGSNKAAGESSFAIGNNTEATDDNSFAAGQYSKANGFVSMSLGRNTITNNMSEFACGQDNVSNKASNTYSDSGNTLFSVGNGVFMSTRHNAFEIRQNGDIYIADTNDTSTTNYYEKPMIKLQDALGGGGTSYTAGDGIDITNDVISVTGKVDTSAITTSISSSSTDSQVPSAKAVYDMIGNINTILESI